MGHPYDSLSLSVRDNIILAIIIIIIIKSLLIYINDILI